MVKSEPKKSGKKTAVPANRASAGSKPTVDKKRKHEEEENEGEDDDNDNDEADDNDSDDSDTEDDRDEDSGSDRRKKKAAVQGGKPKAKKLKTDVNSKSKSSSAASFSKTSSGNEQKKIKQFTKFERLEEARKAYKWWEAPALPEGINWYMLEHPGIVFAPVYQRHFKVFKYDGQVIDLNAEQEELATFYAAMPEDGPQLGNAVTRKVFQDNFFKDFKESFPPGSVVKKFEKCDFSEIRKHLDLQKELRKAATAEEKETKKLDKEKIQLKYGYALIDGRLEKMGNYNMEPPGLFRGRGEHPLTGTVKKRCFPESVSMNISEEAPVPRCPLPGHAWQSVRHDPAVTWLSTWNENVQNSVKYVMLSASSSFKGKSDLDKYQTAIQLKGCIEKVRRDYRIKIKHEDIAQRQLGTAMWVIDVLALRVGGEKGEDEADTVGCCSLRVEHITFNPAPNSLELDLEFLGKDSMLFKQTIDFSKYGDLGKQVFRCLQSFCAKKAPTDDVFETLSPSVLNKHLTGLMPGLTAKVFRTYNASVTLEKELPSAQDLEGLTVQEKVLRYNAANREVAILCNHQRTVSKATETMFTQLNDKLAILKKQKKDLADWLALAKKGNEKKIPLSVDDKEQAEKLKSRLETAIARKEIAVTTEQKLSAAQAVEDAKADVKKDQSRRFEKKHMFKSTPSSDSLKNRLEKWEEDIRKMETDIRGRDENKEVSLGTSKINYMDPRISVAWCKSCEVPIEKIFAKTLRDKFNWAMAVAPSWKFE